jgi:hypothetical protein
MKSPALRDRGGGARRLNTNVKGKEKTRAATFKVAFPNRFQAQQDNFDQQMV